MDRAAPGPVVAWGWRERLPAPGCVGPTPLRLRTCGIGVRSDHMWGPGAPERDAPDCAGPTPLPMRTHGVSVCGGHTWGPRAPERDASGKDACHLCAAQTLPWVLNLPRVFIINNPILRVKGQSTSRQGPGLQPGSETSPRAVRPQCCIG